VRTTNGVTVELLPAASSRDSGLVDRLTDLINDVYTVAEHGLWRDGVTRTTASELAELIAAGQIAVATRDGHIVGSVQVREVSEDTSKLGMLVAAPEQRTTGVGRALLQFAERHSIGRGKRALQLELLIPRALRHPRKEFLRSWYGRCGFRVIRTGCLDDTHPDLAPLLATPCDVEIREKPLRTDATPRLRSAHRGHSGPDRTASPGSLREDACTGSG
jgi:GNAT superfamily N-acetyltransferase